MRLSPGKDFFCAVTTFPSWHTEETSQVLWRNESNLRDMHANKKVYMRCIEDRTLICQGKKGIENWRMVHLDDS